MMIVNDEDILHGLPRLTGTRISVLHIYDQVVGSSQDPAEVANSLDITLAEVYSALAYYYGNPDEIREFREQQKTGRNKILERVVTPPVEADNPE